MAYSELPWKAISWASGVELNYTKKRYRFFITFTNVCFILSRLYVFLFLFERFLHLWFGSVRQGNRGGKWYHRGLTGTCQSRASLDGQVSIGSSTS